MSDRDKIYNDFGVDDSSWRESLLEAILEKGVGLQSLSAMMERDKDYVAGIVKRHTRNPPLAEVMLLCKIADIDITSILKTPSKQRSKSVTTVQKPEDSTQDLRPFGDLGALKS